MLVMYQCQLTAAEQLKPKEKQIEDWKISDMIVLDIFVWSIYMLLFSNNLSSSQNQNVTKMVLHRSHRSK